MKNKILSALLFIVITIWFGLACAVLYHSGERLMTTFGMFMYAFVLYLCSRNEKG